MPSLFLKFIFVSWEKIIWFHLLSVSFVGQFGLCLRTISRRVAFILCCLHPVLQCIIFVADVVVASQGAMQPQRSKQKYIVAQIDTGY